MRRALAVTVGTGIGPVATSGAKPSIIEAIAKSVKDSNPDITYFFVSAESEAHARSVVDILRLPEHAYQIHRVTNPDDVQSSFREIMVALRALVAGGYTPEEISVDFTSGTKALTAGLVLAGVALRCGRLRYTTGIRPHGIVASGTEQFLSIPPATILAYRDLELVRDLIRHLQFRGAIERCREINPILLDQYTQELHRDLGHLANAYDAWDKFDHRRFRGEYHEADTAKPELAPFRLSDGIPQRVLAIGKAIQQQVISEDVLADVFNNAERRLAEGAYDDAVARLYRFTEMVAQRELAKFGIDTSNVDLGKVPASLRDTFEQLRQRDDGTVKIGLYDAYGLLTALGSELGGALDHPPTLRQGLKARNDSILAHGTRPIDEKTARRMRDRTFELAKRAVPDFEVRCRELQFPWLQTTVSEGGADSQGI